jgi:sulfur-carrier protein
VATVWVPSLLRELCAGASQVEASGGTLSELLSDLDARCPGIAGRLLVDGQLRHDLAIFVDGEEAGTLAAAVQPQSEVNILPAMAGGAVEMFR